MNDNDMREIKPFDLFALPTIVVDAILEYTLIAIPYKHAIELRLSNKYIADEVCRIRFGLNDIFFTDRISRKCGPNGSTWLISRYLFEQLRFARGVKNDLFEFLWKTVDWLEKELGVEDLDQRPPVAKLVCDALVTGLRRHVIFDYWRHSYVGLDIGFSSVPLALVVSVFPVEVISWLLEEGFDPNETDSMFGSAVTVAAYQGREDVLRLLLHHGACPDGGTLRHRSEDPIGDYDRMHSRRHQDITPLAFAANAGHLGTTRLLLEQGLDGPYAEHALCRVIATRNIEMFKLILPKDESFCTHVYSYIDLALRKEALDVIELLILQIPDRHPTSTCATSTVFGNTCTSCLIAGSALWRAAQYRNEDAYNLMVQMGIHPLAYQVADPFPWAEATELYYENMTTEWLADRGADPTVNLNYALIGCLLDERKDMLYWYLQRAPQLASELLCSQQFWDDLWHLETTRDERARVLFITAVLPRKPDPRFNRRIFRQAFRWACRRHGSPSGLGEPEIPGWFGSAS